MTVVQKNASIGGGAVILPGVTIGGGALVGAGAWLLRRTGLYIAGVRLGSWYQVDAMSTLYVGEVSAGSNCRGRFFWNACSIGP